MSKNAKKNTVDPLRDLQVKYLKRSKNGRLYVNADDLGVLLEIAFLRGQRHSLTVNA